MTMETTSARRLAGSLRGLTGRNSGIVLSYAIAILLFVVGTIHSRDFASGGHIRSSLMYASFIGLVGLGQSLCILTGGIDLSVPWTLTGAAVLTSILSQDDSSRLPSVFLLILALALAVGLVNGLGVAYVGVPPIIMTLGTSGALQGLLLVYTGGGVGSAAPHALIAFVASNTFGLPTELLLWALVIMLGTILLSGTTLGRQLYAIGTNRRAAFLAGINTRRVLVFPYLVSAVGGALTGILMTGFLGQAFLSMGDPYLFASSAAVAVGGASILGGDGHYIGTVAGAVILTLVAALLPLFSLGAAWLEVSYGVILLVTVFLASLRPSSGT